MDAEELAEKIYNDHKGKLAGVYMDKAIQTLMVEAINQALRESAPTITDEEIEKAAEMASIDFHEYVNTYFTIAFTKGFEWAQKKIKGEKK